MAFTFDKNIRYMRYANRIIRYVVILVLILFAWPFSIPATVIAILIPKKYPRFFGAALVLVAVLILRFYSGKWIFEFFEGASGKLSLELCHLLISWIVGSLIFAGTYWLVRGYERTFPDSEVSQN